MSTSDNASTTWRDLVDQLTPEQVDKLSTFEATSRASEEETAESLLEIARETAGANLVNQVVFANIERPSDARWFNMFSDELDANGVWTRSFEGTERRVGDATVFISGVQREDGTTTRSIGIEATGDYDATIARDIAAALIAAAYELDRLQ